jgi:plastocyanin
MRPTSVASKISRVRLLLGALATIAITGAAVPRHVTGKTVIVNMLYTEKGMRFEPSKITVERGDAVRFVNVSGGPHNVEFDRGTVPVEAIGPLSAAMANELGNLSSGMVSEADAAVTIIFDDVPSGTYRFFCTPHIGKGMTGAVTVR